MKKSVALIIAAVFLASIAVVGFFGMKIVSYNSKVYITEIRLTNPELQTRADGSHYMTFEYRDDLAIPFTFEVSPDNATDRNAVAVRITYQSDEGLAELVSGNILISKPGSLIVRVSSTDGKNVSVSCDIYITMPETA